jgi:hypothetical protein
MDNNRPTGSEFASFASPGSCELIIIDLLSGFQAESSPDVG